MGAENSRKSSFERDGSVVNVSESVVRRVRGLPEPSVREIAEETDRIRDRTMRKTVQYTVDNERILKELERRNAQMLKMSNEEFARAVTEVEKKFLKTSGSPVCQDLQEEVLQCYRNNPNQTLNCSKQVRAFTTCVENARQNALTRRS